MSTLTQEQQTSAAFSKQAAVFDRIEDENKLIVWMRDRIHQEVMRFAKKGDDLLELNCGTGIDALFFAREGIRVHATDNAPGMLEQLQSKITRYELKNRIRTTCCSFNNLADLGEAQAYDHIFSNFGGLNCTDRLDSVLVEMDKLLKPGGRFTLVIMPRICLWEIAMVFRGYFRTAFRRFRKASTPAQVEGIPFNCYYYPPTFIIRHLGARYTLLNLKGLAVTVPPPYIERFVERYPKLFALLQQLEDKICDVAPFNRWGDHYIITMEKRN